MNFYHYPKHAVTSLYDSPYQKLSLAALQALIEDFVTRDGTDYGMVEMSMQEKSAYLLALLKKGNLLITYNDELQSCGLVTKDEVANSSFQDN